MMDMTYIGCRNIMFHLIFCKSFTSMVCSAVNMKEKQGMIYR